MNPRINETQQVKWAATVVSETEYRLYRAMPGQMYLLIATVAQTKQGWKVKPYNDSRRIYFKPQATAALAALHYFNNNAPQRAILNPSNPEEL